MKQSILILLAVSCVAFAQLGVNIVKNPGFEEQDANGRPVYWKSNSGGAPTIWSAVSDIKYEGERSCRYHNERAGYYEFMVQTIPAEPGKTYEFSIYVKQVDLPVEGKKASPNLFMEYAANGRYLGGAYRTEVVTLNTDW